MAKTVEISDELHEAIEAHAAKEGLSVQEYVQRDLRDRLTNAEVIARALSRTRIHLDPSAADIIRQARGPLPGDDGDRR